MTHVEAALAAFLERRSLETAQRLEVVLDESYPNDALVQECVEVLALYRPEGGELLLNDHQIEPHLQRLREHLDLA